MESINIPPKYATESQSAGIAHFLKTRWMLVATITIIAVVVLSIGTIVWVLAQPTRSDSNNSTNSPTPTPASKPSPTPTPTPSPTPTPTPISTPTPTPTPTISANITPFTTADCSGAKQVYVSNQNGTPASQQPPGSWHTVMTYEYGQKLTIICDTEDNEYAPEYALTSDMYVETAHLSTTKP